MKQGLFGKTMQRSPADAAKRTEALARLQATTTSARQTETAAARECATNDVRIVGLMLPFWDVFLLALQILITQAIIGGAIAIVLLVLGII